ncbi:hypothetical protein [Mesorhizobium amorphae]
MFDLTKFLLLETLWTTLVMIAGVYAARSFADSPQGEKPWMYIIAAAVVVAWKAMSGTFNVWRMLLWWGRTVFRPKGSQPFQMVLTSLITVAWISGIISIAIRYASPVVAFFKSTGLSFSF